MSREIIICAENIQGYQNIEVLDKYNELKQVQAKLVEKTKHSSGDIK